MISIQCRALYIWISIQCRALYVCSDFRKHNYAQLHIFPSKSVCTLPSKVERRKLKGSGLVCGFGVVLLLRQQVYSHSNFLYPSSWFRRMLQVINYEQTFGEEHTRQSNPVHTQLPDRCYSLTVWHPLMVVGTIRTLRELTPAEIDDI
ncbi:uncharacterized protein LOC142630549 isoform X3 [Castanea sativa]|uniref:uncharacterized protein LOC142630549 isoform X3 n=1 Tax=Castanea sativa TaxID=21020 RepID=UPI003F64F7F4